ncbi:DeoR/GlpR family DNA-binding transcription regulator [Micromonospora sp. DSM 115977]|uniref:DeoR/GlpR family DNA-binding transcription regulator n=1 Tax=Micromonospora reichwaldensis TaxID=3075516 RepID=A0ABU2WTI0_9ACTN|nr:DeoR/GlpR family DNA-binding transcription regulator [Micromonospora sp. DSM 115977]MDT0528875.1 DeoR/GlpR family DNA-binding transcription regulator [Micromonospora sp. DSM 115977]
MSVQTSRYESAPRRRTQIMAALRRAGFLSVAELSAQLGVSQMTVRRDLRQLAESHEVTLVHGGVSLPPGGVAGPGFASRAQTHTQAKLAIGAAAAALVQPGDTIGIDSGTTAAEVAHALPAEFEGCVVTHSVPVLGHMLSRPRARVIGIGGELLHDNQALVGFAALDLTRRLRIRMLFLGAGAVDERGVYVRSEIELSAKHALMEIADEIVLVVDASKLTATAPVQVCGLDRIDTVVVDAPLPEAVATTVRRNGIRVITA